MALNFNLNLAARQLDSCSPKPYKLGEILKCDKKQFGTIVLLKGGKKKSILFHSNRIVFHFTNTTPGAGRF